MEEKSSFVFFLFSVHQNMFRWTRPRSSVWWFCSQSLDIEVSKEMFGHCKAEVFTLFLSRITELG